MLGPVRLRNVPIQFSETDPKRPVALSEGRRTLVSLSCVSNFFSTSFRFSCSAVSFEKLPSEGRANFSQFDLRVKLFFRLRFAFQSAVTFRGTYLLKGRGDCARCQLPSRFLFQLFFVGRSRRRGGVAIYHPQRCCQP